MMLLMMSYCLTFFFFSVGLVGLINKNMVSSLISKYAQVVLWFCRTGLLPEGSGKSFKSCFNCYPVSLFTTIN